MEVTGARIEQRLQSHLAELQELAIASVYLFGSHATGRSHRESDVDLGVLLPWDRYPDRRDRFALRLRLIGELSRAVGVGVDVVILNDAPPELGRRIVYDGIRLLLADPEADHSYLRDVQLRAADLDPFLRRTRRTTLEALAR